jgi:hypothetical protein
MIYKFEEGTAMKEAKDINTLEQQLDAILNPVAPQIDFVDDLQNRLRQKALIAIEKPDYMVIILLILSGLIFGVIAIWLLKGIFNLKRGDD